MKNKINITNTAKLLMGNNKNTKLLSQINTSALNIEIDHKKIQLLKKASTNINQLNLLEYRTEIKKPEPSSYRSTKENRLYCHSKKNSEVPMKNDIAAIMLKGSSLKIPQEEKKFQSLKKHQNKNNSTGKLVRSNSQFYHQENNANMHNNSNYCHNNTSGIINVNNSHICFSGGEGIMNKGNTNDNSIRQYITELEQTIVILKNYISTINMKLDETINDNFKKKDAEIKKLKIENEFLITSNRELKTKLLEVLYSAKVYDLNEVNRRTKLESLTNQLYNENYYLKQANANTVMMSLNTNTNSNNYRRCSTDNEKNEKRKEKAAKSKDSIYTISQHKRHKTHINLNPNKKEDDDKDNHKEINPLFPSNNSHNNSNNNTIKYNTSSESNSIINEEDSLSCAVSDLGNMIQNLKKRSDSSQKILSYKDEASLSKDNLNNNGSNNANNVIHQPLFYKKTAGNKERKMIEFTK